MRTLVPTPSHLLLKLRSCDAQRPVLVHLVLVAHRVLHQLPPRARVDLTLPELGARQFVLLAVEAAPAGQTARVVVFDAPGPNGRAVGHELPADLSCVIDGGLPRITAEALGQQAQLRAATAGIVARGQDRLSCN